MQRDQTSHTTRRPSSPVLRDLGGVSAALQLLPLPTWLVDEQGELLTCNECFCDRVGVPSSLLVGREWWQAFASASGSIAKAFHLSLMGENEPNGTATLQLLTADGQPWEVALAWKKLTEPGTRRPLWVLTSTHWIAAIEASKQRFDFVSLLRPSELSVVLAEAPTEQRMEVLHGLAAQEPACPSRPPSIVLQEALSLLPAGIKCSPVRMVHETEQHVLGHRVDAARIVALVLTRAFRNIPSDAIVELRTFAEPGHVCFSVHVLGAEPSNEELAAANAPLAGPTAPHPLAIARALAHSVGGSLRWSRDTTRGSVLLLSLPAVSSS